MADRLLSTEMSLLYFETPSIFMKNMSLYIARGGVGNKFIRNVFSAYQEGEIVLIGKKFLIYYIIIIPILLQISQVIIMHLLDEQPAFFR